MYVQLYPDTSIWSLYIWLEIHNVNENFIGLLTNDSVWEKLFKMVLTENLLHENQHLIIHSLNTRQMLVFSISIYWSLGSTRHLICSY